MSCIVIAKLVGILYFNKIEVYKLDCGYSNNYIIIKDNEYKEVELININKDLTYNIKEI